MTLRCIAIGCAIFLTGCAGWPGTNAPQASGAAVAREERESQQVLELIAYAQKVASLAAEEQQRELNASGQTLSKQRGAYGRVKLALLLSMPGTGFADDAKAAGLLEPLVSGDRAASSPLQQFAGLLHAQINERLREQRRAAQMKEQLDALKDVERKILEREQAKPK
jgi:hypothetical protein